MKVKTQRTDIPRNSEVDMILANAEAWLQCVIALAWMFGKRINEILRLKREDVYTEGDYLYARFLVGKKKSREDQPIPKPYLKRISLTNPYCEYVLAYIKEIKEGYIFRLSQSRELKDSLTRK